MIRNSFDFSPGDHNLAHCFANLFKMMKAFLEKSRQQKQNVDFCLSRLRNEILLRFKSDFKFPRKSTANLRDPNLKQISMPL